MRISLGRFLPALIVVAGVVIGDEPVAAQAPIDTTRGDRMIAQCAVDVMQRRIESCTTEIGVGRGIAA